MEYIERVREYSVYYDNDRLYVEDKDATGDFAAIFEVPPSIDSENPVEWLREKLRAGEGFIDMQYRIQKTHGKITQESVPQGLSVDRRPRQDGTSKPVSAPSDEAGPPDWANPELGGKPRYPDNSQN